MNLHYGCGMMVGEGWRNCDGSPTLRLQRLPGLGFLFRRFLPPLFPGEVHYGNIVTGLSLGPDSCEAIYCSHMLEHLSLKDCRTALRNTHRYLHPGGLFRLVVPDFERQVAVYRESAAPSALIDFLGYTFLGRKERPKGLLMHLREIMGNSHHLWMWDFKSMAAELEAAGFRQIRRCNFGDSPNPAFAAVESAPRFEDALAIECTK